MSDDLSTRGIARQHRRMTSDLGLHRHGKDYLAAWADKVRAERDALAEDEHAAVQELDRLRDAAQEYFEATLPLLNDYPLTDSERGAAWQRLRETNRALRAALHREDGA